MDFIKMIERVKTANILIKAKRTGTPEAFATHLGVSKRQLYNILDFFKEYGATIKYSRSQETFYFMQDDFELHIHFSIMPINTGEIERISGGFLQNYSSVQFHFMEQPYI